MKGWNDEERENGMMEKWKNGRVSHYSNNPIFQI